MQQGLLLGAAGLRALSLRLDQAASNLANVSTTGFRRDGAVFRIADRRDGPALDVRPYIDLSQGPTRRTHRPLDLALEGEGFFVVDVDGQERYTRDGRFRIDPSGRLVTQDGYAVQGAEGPLDLGGEGEIRVGPTGVIERGGRSAGRLRLAAFGGSTGLRKAGRGTLSAEGDPKAASPKVLQGYQEGSNVRSVEEMGSLIRILRAFESVQRSMRVQDDATGRLIAAYGRFS